MRTVSGSVLSTSRRVNCPGRRRDYPPFVPGLYTQRGLAYRTQNNIEQARRYGPLQGLTPELKRAVKGRGQPNSLFPAGDALKFGAISGDCEACQVVPQGGSALLGPFQLEEVGGLGEEVVVHAENVAQIQGGQVGEGQRRVGADYLHRAD